MFKSVSWCCQKSHVWPWEVRDLSGIYIWGLHTIMISFLHILHTLQIRVCLITCFLQQKSPIKYQNHPCFPNFTIYNVNALRIIWVFQVKVRGHSISLKRTSGESPSHLFCDWWTFIHLTVGRNTSHFQKIWYFCAHTYMQLLLRMQSHHFLF